MENLTLSLVREFLTTHRLQDVLELLDKQFNTPHQKQRTKRSDLVKQLGITKQYHQTCKQAEQRKPPILQVLITEYVKFLEQKRKKRSEKLREKTKVVESKSTIEQQLDKTNGNTCSKQESVTTLFRGVRKAGTDLNVTKMKDVQQQKFEFHQEQLATARKVTTTQKKPSHSFHNRSKSFIPSQAHQQSNFTSNDFIEINDIDDDDKILTDPLNSEQGHMFPPQTQTHRVDSTFITGESVDKLWSVIGSRPTDAMCSYESWNHPIEYHSCSSTLPLITQNEGGPCGMLAVLQAFAVREHLNSIHETAHETLLKALTEMLWNCTDYNQEKKVVLFSKKRKYGLEVINSTTRKNTEVQLKTVLNSSEWKASGLFCLLVSAACTRGADNILQDMDQMVQSVETPTLIATYGYCSQELVNLLMFGKAVSHLHSGKRLFGGGDRKSVV